MTKFFFFFKNIWILGDKIKKVLLAPWSKYLGSINIFRVKLILFSFTCIYAVILFIIFYFLFKSYQSSMEYVNTIRIRELHNDVTSLISSHPLQYQGQGQLWSGNANDVAYNSNNINQIYQIHGISNYRDFIYPSLATTQSAQDVTMLTNILASNPDVDARLSSLVFQDIIRDYSGNIMDITHKYLKSALKFSLPLAASLLLLGAVGLTGVVGQYGVETPITVIKIVECYLI